MTVVYQCKHGQTGQPCPLCEAGWNPRTSRNEAKLIHESSVGTYHSPENGSWTINDTRGYIDGGPSCDECGACECEAECNCPLDSMNDCNPEHHSEFCSVYVNQLDIECIGLSFAYVNMNGGESLCEDCATTQGITIESCTC